MTKVWRGRSLLNSPGAAASFIGLFVLTINHVKPTESKQMRDWQAEDHRQKAKTKKSTSQIDHKQKHFSKKYPYIWCNDKEQRNAKVVVLLFSKSR